MLWQHFSLIHFRTYVASICVAFGCNAAVAAKLPDHQPISLLIFADEVNPHRLADADLTQPQDLAPALSANDSALKISRITTVNSQCADDALHALASTEPPDVVLYFAHRAAKHCDGRDAQSEFTQLIEQGLKRSTGVVVLHHGLYVDFVSPGAKDALLQLLGARANSIAWDTTEGSSMQFTSPLMDTRTMNEYCSALVWRMV